LKVDNKSSVIGKKVDLTPSDNVETRLSSVKSNINHSKSRNSKTDSEMRSSNNLTKISAKKKNKKKSKPEIYISTDVEADGPIPGPFSMLSFASAAFTKDKKLVSTFSANLETLPDAKVDPKTKAWWDEQPEAYAACRTDLREPGEAMADYLKWIKTLPGKPVFVGYPATYDFMFVHWYVVNFTGETPFSHAGLDMKTLAMSMMKTPFRETAKRNMPKEWHDKLPHTHVALDDAIEQGALFCNMLAAQEGKTLPKLTTEEISKASSKVA